MVKRMNQEFDCPKILTFLEGVAESRELSSYLKEGGYKALKKAFKKDEIENAFDQELKRFLNIIKTIES